MSEPEPDIVIVGAGVGGSALAATMARADKSVVLLEKTSVHTDRVLGEWVAPWGVKELKRLELYDALAAAGGYEMQETLTFDELMSNEEALAGARPVAGIMGFPGPLCIGHPPMCDALNSEAVSAGAELLRGISQIEVEAGARPSVSFKHDDKITTLRPRLVVGADGRASTVRKKIGLELRVDPVIHFFCGMLVEGIEDLSPLISFTGTEGDVFYTLFPQGEGKGRLYLGISPDEPSRFAGKDGPEKFLDVFRSRTMPFARGFENARPAGPCAAFPNADSWLPRPYVEGVVLIGDAAGYNDPLIGQGLANTFRDVRLVRDLLLESDAWNANLFGSYGQERSERTRRLRFMGRVSAELKVTFGDDKVARRRRYNANRKADPKGKGGWIGATMMVGPDKLPPKAFDRASWAWHLGDDEPFPDESLGPKV